jgi:uncharacterized protein
MAHPRLELMDWKRRVAAMYAAVRAAGGTAEACGAFRGQRDELFVGHPASPLPEAQRAGFPGLPYFPHRAEMRVEAELEPDAEGAELVIPTSTGEPARFTRIGLVRPVLGGESVSLAVYWLEGYGGGLFLPFRDALAGAETYGGGRYLLDTVKGADLGASADAPPENRIAEPVEAGERMAPPA